MKNLTISIVLACGALAVASPNDFVSTWKADGVTTIDFAGRKVAGVVVTDDNNLRVAGEEALAREITARGPQGVPAYRIIPKEEVRKSDAAKGWFDRAGVAGLVIMRPVATETTKVYSSALWVSGYYNYAWDYWGTSWASVYPLGKGRDQHTITVETLLYDLSTGTPMWACVTRTTDPSDVQSYMTHLAADIVTRLQKDGLRRK
jgi:hypothetical protein